MVSTPTQINSNERLASLTPVYLPQQNQKTLEKTHIYKIHTVKRSENAKLLFHNDNDKYVFKILQPYKDHRYSLKELTERQACLIEGWYWNRLFSPDVYVGFARLYNYDPEQDQPSQIEVGRFLDPDREPLVENAEYALVMWQLPQPSRLDMLLKNGNDASRQRYADIMTQFLAHIHTNLAFELDEPSKKIFWGSVGQLKEKLTNNLVSVEKPGVPDKTVLISAAYDELLEKCRPLRETLLPVLTDNKYREFQQYFVQRIRKQQIKHCHGDLKARNIWITRRRDSAYSEIWSGVRVLDAVDFNPEFRNIDTLSDFAMLVADIHARTDSLAVVDSMVDDYLRLTKQEDKGSRFVLNYYLIEKAFVGALVSILYDKDTDLGQQYLKVCDGYLTKLRSFFPHILKLR